MKPSFPDSMRRWTLLLVSHDSEAPRTYSVSEQTVRVGVLLGIAFVLVAMIGVGTVVARFGSLSPQPAAQVAGVARLSDAEVSPEVRTLRHRVARLHGVLDTIRQHESQLRAAAGMPGTDTTTMMRRFFSLIPSFLRPRHGVQGGPDSARGGGPAGSVSAAGALSTIDWSDSAAARAQIGQTGAGADSLAEHASVVASGFNELANGNRIRRDTIEIFSLRPESLSVALTRGQGTTRHGHALTWAPQRTSAIAAGMDAAVTRLLQLQGGAWEMELRAVGGTVAQISAPGRPLVRLGEKVAQDQLLIVVEPQSEAPVRIEVRRNGVPVEQ